MPAQSNCSPVRYGYFLNLFLVVMLFLMLFAGAQSPVLAQNNPPEVPWVEATPTPKPFRLTDSYSCSDKSQLSISFISTSDPAFAAEEPGTYKFNWLTGEKKLVTSHFFTSCNPLTGLLYSTNYSRHYRFSMYDLQLREIEHPVTHIGNDGSFQVYSYFKDGVRIWASADGGLTWIARPVPALTGRLLISNTDARVLYFRGEEISHGKNPPLNSLKTRLYFSGDAGATWEFRSEEVRDIGGFGSTDSLSLLPGGNTPVNMIATVGRGNCCSTGHIGWSISLDGGRSFNAGAFGSYDIPMRLISTPRGLLRAAQQNRYVDRLDFTMYLDVLDAAGKWQRLNSNQQFLFESPDKFLQPINNPSNLFLSDDEVDGTWHSPDSGLTWYKLNNQAIFLESVTEYEPLTLRGSRNGQFYTLIVPNSGKSLINPVVPNNSPGGYFFPETGHNLYGAFKKYWETHGGLAQFGYPRTEPFREYNSTDGKIYLVQYFERNRLEYHPEYVGTPYEVLSGLLGNQLTSYLQQEKPFKRTEDSKTENNVYFPQTGHNMQGVFKNYWETHGGLEIFGYPISEEYEAVNTDDGKTYVVQYFERSRFEYHPENAGTTYEVLLGLLGNRLMQQKGWLPTR